jgi:DNA-binding SARP family transcriptional activator
LLQRKATAKPGLDAFRLCAVVRFWVLGQFAIEADGVTLEPPRASRARSLLAWLALHPGPHPRSRLAARFWPEVLDSSARASLRVALSELRTALGSATDCVVADRNQAGLVADRVRVDALEFAALEARGELEAALELCRGELLPELDDDWVLEARDAHTAALVDGLGRLASEREAGGDLEAAISLSRRMVAIDPLGEAPTRELMRRLAMAGERGSAIAAYQRLAERLQSQLRLAPSAATRALADQLRTPEAAKSVGESSEAPETTFELAVSHYHQAVERAVRNGEEASRLAELLVGLGVAQARAGRTGEAQAAFQEASKIARRLGDPRQFAQAVLGLAGIGVTILDVDEGLAGQLSDALALLPEGESDLRAELLARLAIARAYSPDRQESARIAEQAVEMARSHDQPATLARALCARHVSLGAPDALEQRLATATEMLELADRAGDRESALQARNFRVTDVLEAGDVAGFDRELEAYAALGHEFPLPAFRWYIPLWRATRATINGDFDEATRLAARARREGRQAGEENAELFWRLQTGTLMLIQRRLDADTAWVEDHARNSPAGSAWWTVLTWIWAEQGRHADAKAVMDRLAERQFATLERDMNWMSAIAELTEACRLLNDTERAAILYQQLLPFAGRIATCARGAQAYGPVDYFLGLAAETTGQSSVAHHHLSAAVALSEACGAHAWAQAARRHLAP